MENKSFSWEQGEGEIKDWTLYQLVPLEIRRSCGADKEINFFFLNTHLVFSLVLAGSPQVQTVPVLV